MYMLFLGYILIGVLVCAYLFVIYKITMLWNVGYSKKKLLVYTTVVLLIATELCYNVYEKQFCFFILLLTIIVYSLIAAYYKMKK